MQGEMAREVQEREIGRVKILRARSCSLAAEQAAQVVWG